MIEVNLTGAYLCAQGALPLMREQGSGTIVNISSMAGKRASISAGVAYCASKHGLGSLALPSTWRSGDGGSVPARCVQGR